MSVSQITPKLWTDFTSSDNTGNGTRTDNYMFQITVLGVNHNTCWNELVGGGLQSPSACLVFYINQLYYNVSFADQFMESVLFQFRWKAVEFSEFRNLKRQLRQQVHVWPFKFSSRSSHVLTFALLRLDPAGSTGGLDCPEVDCHRCPAGQVCHSGQKQEAKITTKGLDSIMSSLLLLVQSTLFLSPTVKYLHLIFTCASYKMSYINQSWLFSHMRTNTKIKLEHTWRWIYICFTPRTLSTISKECKGHWEIRKKKIWAEEIKAFQKGHNLFKWVLF